MPNCFQFVGAQHPSLIVEAGPLGDGGTWVECRTSGRANYLSKGPIEMAW